MGRKETPRAVLASELKKLIWGIVAAVIGVLFFLGVVVPMLRGTMTHR